MRRWQINAIDIVNFSRYFLPLQLLINMLSEETVSGVETVLETGNNGLIADVISLHGELNSTGP